MTSGRPAIAARLALAGGQDEQPWLSNSSTTTGCALAAAAGRANAAARLAIRSAKRVMPAISRGGRRRLRLRRGKSAAAPFSGLQIQPVGGVTSGVDGIAAAAAPDPLRRSRLRWHAIVLMIPVSRNAS